MKMNTLLALGSLIFATSSAQADFPVQAEVFLTPQQVTLSVVNVWSAPIVCQGQFFAQTYSMPYGIWLPFSMGSIVAGTYGYVYLDPPYVYQGDYFLAVPTVNVECAFEF